ncbi:MAG: hypothetical protein DRN19_05360, partial [Thermoplasmata archaeon]
MEKRVLLAMVISFAIIFLFNYLYMKFMPAPQPPQTQPSNKTQIKKKESLSTTKKIEAKSKQIKIPQFLSTNLKTYILESPKYKVSITSKGARFNKFQLKEYSKEKNKKEPIELVSAPFESLPLEIYLESASEIA